MRPVLCVMEARASLLYPFKNSRESRNTPDTAPIRSFTLFFTTLSHWGVIMSTIRVYAYDFDIGPLESTGASVMPFGASYE
jgi:hypothetical protein